MSASSNSRLWETGGGIMTKLRKEWAVVLAMVQILLLPGLGAYQAAAQVGQVGRSIHAGRGATAGRIPVRIPVNVPGTMRGLASPFSVTSRLGLVGVVGRMAPPAGHKAFTMRGAESPVGLTVTEGARAPEAVEGAVSPAIGALQSAVEASGVVAADRDGAAGISEETMTQAGRAFDQTGRAGYSDGVWARVFGNERGYLRLSAFGLDRADKASGGVPVPNQPEQPKGAKGAIGTVVDMLSIPALGSALYYHLDKVAIAVGSVMFLAMVYLPVNSVNLFPVAASIASEALSVAAGSVSDMLSFASTHLLRLGSMTEIYSTVLALPGHVAGFVAPALRSVAAPLAETAEFFLDKTHHVKWDTLATWSAQAGAPMVAWGIGAMAVSAVPYIREISDMTRKVYLSSGSRLLGFTAGGALAAFTPILLLRDGIQKLLSVEFIKRIARAVKKAAIHVYDYFLTPIGHVARGVGTGIAAYGAAAVVTPVITMSALSVFIASGVLRLWNMLPRTRMSLVVSLITTGLVATQYSVIWGALVALSPVNTTLWWALATGMSLIGMTFGSYYGYKLGFIPGLQQARQHGSIRWAETFLQKALTDLKKSWSVRNPVPTGDLDADKDVN